MVTAHSKVSTAKTIGSLIDEIRARHTVDPIRDDDVTIYRLTKETGWGRQKCERVIAEDVAARLLIEVIVLDERNHKTRAWRRP